MWSKENVTKIVWMNLQMENVRRMKKVENMFRNVFATAIFATPKIMMKTMELEGFTSLFSYFGFIVYLPYIVKLMVLKYTAMQFDEFFSLAKQIQSKFLFSNQDGDDCSMWIVYNSTISIRLWFGLNKIANLCISSKYIQYNCISSKYWF